MALCKRNALRRGARFTLSTALLGTMPFVTAGITGCSGDDEEAVAQGIDESFLDRSVSPCTDFYQFACGTWIAEHPTTQSPAIERFLEGDSRSAYLLEKILESDQMRAPYVPHERSDDLGQYYGSCMTSRAGSTIDRTVLDGRRSQIAAASTKGALAEVVAALHSDGIEAFFDINSSTDPGNPDRYVATFFDAGRSLPDRRYYLDATMSVLPQYEDHIRRLISLVSTTPAIDPAAVIKVEVALAKGIDEGDNTGDPIAAYNLLAFDAFTATSPNFPWADYMRNLGLPAVAEINVRRPVYLMRLDALWQSATIDELKSYLLWRILEDYAETMGSTVVAEEARFHFGVFYGTTTPSPPWWACQQSTKWALGFSLSRPYVEIMFDDEKKKASHDLIDSIKQAFRQRLASRTWIDSATRQEAEIKLDKVIDKVGYPDVWPNDPPIPMGGSFQNNVLEVRRAKRRVDLEWLGRPVNRQGWWAPPCTTNAFYSPSQNEIVFPAAILQTPLFSVRRPRALNYGVIGAVMGHELTHGFDDDGRKYDGDGKLRTWWSEATDQEYVARSKCISDQYAGYEAVPGVSLDGSLTLGENIADLGGLKLAYAAYHATGANETFSGSFGPDAQFFISYAQIWCANFKDEIQRSRVRTDPHAPPRFRVNGVVRNMPEFAATFQCAAGTPMAPQDRCEVW
ncbi:MAG: M13 family metallopeptidase [Polyangiaceae bacterium]